MGGLKKCTDECQGQIQELNLQQFYVLWEMLDSIIMKKIEKNSLSLSSQKRGKRDANLKIKARNLLYGLVQYEEKIIRFLYGSEGSICK